MMVLSMELELMDRLLVMKLVYGLKEGRTVSRIN